MNRTAAIAYIQSHASPEELAALDAIINSEPPARAVVDNFLAGQRSDGGWAPFWSADYSSLDATCFRLAKAIQLGLNAFEPALTRAGAFLARRQAKDGAFEEDISAAASAPPWARPGDPAARLYITANCGFWIATLQDDMAAARRTGNYLFDHLGADGRLPSFLQAHWLAAALWLRLRHVEPVERTLGYLDARLDTVHAAGLAWMLTALLSAGLPPGHALLSAAFERLDGLQTAQGSWPDDEKMGAEVYNTLTALQAYRLCGRI